MRVMPPAHGTALGGHTVLFKPATERMARNDTNFPIRLRGYRGRDPRPPRGYRLALDRMVRELAEGGAGTTEIAEREEFIADRITHPE
jgi:hypothetical protein